MTANDDPKSQILTKATELVDEFVTALVNSRIYELSHPRLQTSLTRVVDHVRALARETRSDRVRIVCSEGMVFFSGQPLLGASLAAPRLLRLVDGWNAGGVELARQIDATELATFFACIVASKERPEHDYRHVNRQTSSRRCLHAQLLPPAGDRRGSRGAGGGSSGGGGGSGGGVGSGGGGSGSGPGGGGCGGGSGGGGGGGGSGGGGGGNGGGADGFDLAAFDDAGPGGGGGGRSGRQSYEEEQMRIGMRSYQGVMDMLQSVTVSVCRGGTIDFSPVFEQAELVLEHLEMNGTALLGLARQEQYDAFTFGHSIRVAILAMNFARALTADRELQIRIGAAALLHDVGKSLVPFEILHSNKRLSEDERREMGRHAELGAKCLLDHHDSDPLAIVAAFGHHLSPDGTGYPRTVHEHPITWITSIVKICDIFEALTAARPYKSAMAPIRAYRIMLAMGEKLDRGLLKRFIEINGIYPVGQRVELEDGVIAVVDRQTDDPLHPVVVIVQHGDGSEPDPEDNEPFDLREIACPNVRMIVREVLGETAPTPDVDHAEDPNPANRD